MEKANSSLLNISVIIPNYNHSVFLKSRIESVLNQTHHSFEVILLDDCSNDNSWDILLSYSQHPKVTHCVRNEINSGSPFKQWKKGIELAKGEWIWIAESDDFSDAEFISKMFSGVHSPAINVLFCNSQFVDSESNELPVSTLGEQHGGRRWAEGFICQGIELIKNTMVYFNGIPNASAVIFRKAAVDFQALTLEMRYCGDWIFWTSLLKHGEVVYVPEKLNKYRQHSNTTRGTKSIKEERSKLNEYFAAIRYARKIAGKDSFLLQGPVHYYEWIFSEMKFKSKKTGVFNSYILFSQMPLGLYGLYVRMLYLLLMNRLKHKMKR